MTLQKKKKKKKKSTASLYVSLKRDKLASKLKKRTYYSRVFI